MSGLLRDQVAIVTGGGWNIGRAVAERFAAEGAKVVIASRNQENLDATVAAIAAAGGEVMAQPTDVTQLDQVEALVAATLQRYGTVDILAAAAGGSGAHQPIDQVDPLDWDQVFSKNLRATFNSARVVLPTMRQHNKGRILTFTGGGAFFPWVGVNATAYACSKAAICRFTDQLQAELLDTGINVNCVEPGMVWSPHKLKMVEEEEARTGKPHPERGINRPPDDAAELALFLASSQSDGLRGRIVSVADDWWRDPDGVRRIEETVHLYRLRRADY